MEIFLFAFFDFQLDVYNTKYSADENLYTVNNQLYESNYFKNNLFQYNLISNYSIKKNSIIFGIGGSIEDLMRRDFNKKQNQNLNFLLCQLEGLIFNKANYILGSRIDKYNDYESVFSNKIAFGFKLKKVHLNTSLATGFKTPDFRQQYFDFTNSTMGYTVYGKKIIYEKIIDMQNNDMIAQLFVPLSNLDNQLLPESSLNINFGVKYVYNENWYFRFKYFNNKIQKSYRSANCCKHR